MGLQHDKLMAMLSPADRENVLKACLSWGYDPDSPEFIPFALVESSLIRIEMVQKSIESLITTMPQHQKASLDIFTKTLTGYSTSIEKTFTDETQRRSELIAEAVGKKLEAVLANSRAPLVANIWLSVVVGFAACSGTLCVFWIVYRYPWHGWLAVTAAGAAVLAQWGAPFCRWFKDLIYSDGNPVGRG